MNMKCQFPSELPVPRQIPSGREMAAILEAMRTLWTGRKMFKQRPEVGDIATRLHVYISDL